MKLVLGLDVVVRLHIDPVPLRQLRLGGALGSRMEAAPGRGRRVAFPYCPLMVELGTDPAAGGGIRLRWANRSVTRIVAIAVAVSATALWMSVAWGDRNPYSRSGIGAMTLTGLLAVMLPLALRANRASMGTADDGARIAAAVAAALLVIGTAAFADHYAVAAHFADGTHGIVEVDSVICQQTCLWSGIFWVRQGPHRDWVIKRDWVTLTDGPGQGLNRHYIPAIDTGDPSQVYPPGGGSQWVQVKTIAVAAPTAACSLIAAVLRLRYRRYSRYRRRRRLAERFDAA